jgi:opacity protein-like surface antigen
MRIRRSLLIASFIIANIFNATALAGGIETQSISPFSRGYAGIGLGPSFQLVKQSLFQQITGIVLPSGLSSTQYSIRQGDVVFLGNIHLGYGHSFRNGFYVGAELFGECYSHSTGFSHNLINATGAPPTFLSTEIHKVRMNNAYGLLIRPGLQPTPESIIYLSLGAAFTQIKNMNTYSLSQLPALPIIYNVTDNRQRSSKAGFRIGLGTAIALAKHVAFRLDYFYTTYGHVNPAQRAFAVASLPGDILTITDTAKISTHAVLFNFDFPF